MNLENLLHGLIFFEDRLLCADEQNPKNKTLLIDTSKVTLFVKDIDWYQTQIPALRAKYLDNEYEIDLCEGCLEKIIICLLT